MHFSFLHTHTHLLGNILEASFSAHPSAQRNIGYCAHWCGPMLQSCPTTSWRKLVSECNLIWHPAKKRFRWSHQLSSEQSRRYFPLKMVPRMFWKPPKICKEYHLALSVNLTTCRSVNLSVNLNQRYNKQLWFTTFCARKIFSTIVCTKTRILFQERINLCHLSLWWWVFLTQKSHLVPLQCFSCGTKLHLISSWMFTANLPKMKPHSNAYWHTNACTANLPRLCTFGLLASHWWRMEEEEEVTRCKQHKQARYRRQTGDDPALMFGQ